MQPTMQVPRVLFTPPSLSPLLPSRPPSHHISLMSSRNYVVICRCSSALHWIPEWLLPMLMVGTASTLLTALLSPCRLHMLHTGHYTQPLAAVSCCCAPAVSGVSTRCVCSCLQPRHKALSLEHRLHTARTQVCPVCMQSKS